MFFLQTVQCGTSSEKKRGEGIGFGLTIAARLFRPYFTGAHNFAGGRITRRRGFTDDSQVTAVLCQDSLKRPFNGKRKRLFYQELSFQRIFTK
jgi:hypothetical protein